MSVNERREWEANNDSWDSVSISADGRYVAFTSAATNLVPGDTSSLRNDVFVYDRQTKDNQANQLVTRAGKEGNNSSGSPAISADGRYVAFLSYRPQPRVRSRHQPVAATCSSAISRPGTTRRVSLSAEGTSRPTKEASDACDERRRAMGGLHEPLANEPSARTIPNRDLGRRRS